MKFNPVILSGGAGTRLWPVSRTSFPKQFIPFFEESLFTQTLMRVKSAGSPWVVTTRDLQTLTEKTFRGFSLPLSQIIYEPFGKNTAGAIALLCRQFELLGKSSEIVGVFPADHRIEDEAAFQMAVESAIHEAQNDVVVTLGLKPTFPATGYGYIETNDQSPSPARSVRRFCEKPDRETAQEFVREGRFLWNAGMFFFRVSTMIQHFKNLAPTLWLPFENLNELPFQTERLKEVYQQIPSISIDYAVMEKLSEQRCIPCDLGWNDLGCWDDLFAEIEKSGQSTSADFEVDSRGNQYFSLRPKTTAFVGIDNIMVVETDDALLICKKGESQKVKTIVDQLKTEQSLLAHEHTFEVRPWGKFEILRDDDHFKSKIITVDPQSAISYQSHQKRQEIWVVVKGQGEVLLDGKSTLLDVGDAIKIPIQSKHRIKNPGSITLEFIEVQTGTYFGEDDIQRYQDNYGRS